MSDPESPGPLPGLPPALAALDAELAEFTPAERPSFAPELESELETAWSRDPGPGPPPRRGRFVAAVIAGVLVTGAALPPARASIAQRVDSLLGSLRAAPPTRLATAAPSSPDRWPDSPPAVLDSPPDPLRQAAEAEAEGAGVVVESPGDLPAFLPVRISYPTLIDQDAGRRLIREFYPRALQRQGVGGTVGLLFWVTEEGTVDQLRVKESSGVAALDRAALQGAGSLRFHPATRGGSPVGTYVEFDLVFTPGDEMWAAPRIDPIAAPSDPEISGWALSDDGPLGVVVPRKLRIEARELLVLAMGDSEGAIEGRLGPIDGLLAGEPPPGVGPLRWRRDAIGELERAIVRDPDNPAPPLALARIRRRQGLRSEARVLLASGLESVARKTRPVSPQLVAEIAYELGDIVREIWRSQTGLGVIGEAVVDDLACSRRDPSGSTIETLVAWNFVCPTATEGVLHTEFQPLEVGAQDQALMLEHFRAALAAVPDHVGSNVALLLEDADAGRWLDLLAGARRFGTASQGHPYGLLLEGLALQRLRRAEEAAVAFDRALAALGPELAADFRDPGSVDVVGEGEDGWNGLDPILLTAVNERETEHLARAAYAYLRFGDLDSDGSRIWLRYGAPQRVRALGTTKVRTEFWDYGPGPDFTFTRAGDATVRHFTPEAAAYLQELRSVFPEWYGTQARTLYTLPAQVARSRGEGVGEVVIEVHFEVPGALRQQKGDSVQLGLFLVEADGALRRVEHRWTREATVSLQAAYGPEVAEVVVEVLDPGTHQAAGLRVPAFAEGGAEGWGALSDLLLLRPAGGASGAAVPLTGTEIVSGEPLAVSFELIPDETNRWRMWVEVSSETREMRRMVPSRRGETGRFHASHTVIREGGRGVGFTAASRMTEVLEVDLSRIPPDSYLLRVVLETDDGLRIASELPVQLRPADAAVRSALSSPPPAFGGGW